MISIGERNFHLLMGGLFLAAVVVDNALPRILPAWEPPDVGLLSLVAGLVWVGRYVAWRQELRDERGRVEKDRIERLERRLDAFEDDYRERHQRPL